MPPEAGWVAVSERAGRGAWAGMQKEPWFEASLFAYCSLRMILGMAQSAQIAGQGPQTSGREVFLL